MGLPGFAADSSLYRTSVHYQMAAGGESASPTVAIAGPAAPPVCPVGGCPVRVFGCGVCAQRESCCFLETVISGGFTNEYYACQNLQTSTSDCGACGHKCTPGEVCCNGTCVDPTSPAYKCSAQCGCAGGMTCQNGSCKCPSGQTNCNGHCANLSSDLENCGSCGNFCPDLGNTECVNGKCQCTVSGDIICNGSCTNPLADSRNCGFCGNVCDEAAGYCCNSGNCFGTQLRSDPNNCGTCGNRCFSNCCSNGACADLLTDPNNCGSCGTACVSRCCTEGACADLSSDPNNCGLCGNVCASRICCSGQCINSLFNDPNNCGACGNVCANGCCSRGVCANLATDPGNCGTCGQVCPLNSCCNNGACTSVPSLSSLSQNPGNCNKASTSTNYWLGTANCANLQGLSVTLDVSRELYSANGFSLQLNAVPPPSSSGQIDWVQYAFLVNLGSPLFQIPATVSGWVEYWNQAFSQSSACIVFTNQDNANCCSNADCCDSVCGTLVRELPGLNPEIPPNYTLQISLSTNPGNGNVTQATFAVTDSEGNRNSLNVPIPASRQVPIQAFQFVAVGLDNCAAATFTNESGGLIKYSVQSGQQLCVQGAGYTCPFNGYSGFTGESSNAGYGTMDSCCGAELQQTLLNYTG